MTGAASDGRPPRVLADHRRMGKRFVPPFVHALGNLDEVGWADGPLPEFLWLALLSHEHGLRRGAELAVEAARAADAATSSSKNVWFAPASSYGILNEQQRQSMLATLKAGGLLDDVRSALACLIALYPECPLSFLFDKEPSGARPDHLSRLRTVVADLYDKTSKAAMLMQANAVYIAFATDMLFVAEFTSLANFPGVADYPETEESRRVGTSVRAAIMGLFGLWVDQASPWPSYFWNRGLEIDSCSFDTEVLNG